MKDCRIVLVIPWKQLADNDPWSLQVQFLGLTLILSLPAAVATAKRWKSISYSGRDLNDLGFSEL